MLDSDTRKKIDTARDILVGKVPDPKSQVEQITIALIYKFMDDMDKEAVEWGGKAAFFTGKFEKYGWSKIFNPRISGFELINLYSEALDKLNHNPKIPQLFRDIFKNAYLPYRDPETLKSFLKEINGFSYEHSEKLGDAYEYLLSVLGSQGDAGQFRTPRHIIDFMVEAINPQKNETILDPACGTAGFLISSYKHILKQNTENSLGDKLTPDEKKRLMNNFLGYDISPDMVRISLVNMYLHGFSKPTIHEYDTLTSEERWNETADVILANPPFMSPKGGIKPHKKFSIQAKRSEVLFVDYMAEHLNPNGRAGIIVPEGIIFQSQTAYKDLRKILIENYLYAVVSLPAGVFNPYSGVKTSILLLDKSLSKKTDKILFLKIENDGFDLGAQRRQIDKNDLPLALEELQKYKNAIFNNAGFDLSDSKIANLIAKGRVVGNGDYSLNVDRYLNSGQNTISDYKYTLIGDVSELITKGTTPTSIGFNFTDEGINFIKIESISDEGKFIPSKFAHITEECNKSLSRSQLEEGDILFSIAGAFGRAAVVNKNILPANTNQALAIIRLKKEIILPKYLFLILKSKYIYNEIQKLKVGVAQYNLSLQQINNISFPLPPLEVQKKIVSAIESYQKEIDELKKQIDIKNQLIKDKIAGVWGAAKE